MIDNLILDIGIMIIAGFFGGRLVNRFGFPMITGYIVVGIILSPSLLNVVAEARIEDLNIFTSIALGIIAYSIGGRLKWETIRVQEKSILIIGLTQAIGAWILSMLAVTMLTPLFFDMPGAGFSNTYFPMGLVIGALASATAPAVILALVREYRAKGALTTTLLSVT